MSIKDNSSDFVGDVLTEESTITIVCHRKTDNIRTAKSQRNLSTVSRILLQNFTTRWINSFWVRENCPNFMKTKHKYHQRPGDSSAQARQPRHRSRQTPFRSLGTSCALVKNRVKLIVKSSKQRMSKKITFEKTDHELCVISEYHISVWHIGWNRVTVERGRGSHLGCRCSWVIDKNFLCTFEHRVKLRRQLNCLQENDSFERQAFWESVYARTV